MTNTAHTIADALREVTASVQRAIGAGHRARRIDADDVIEILLAVADRLDPPVREAPATEAASD